MEKRYTYKEQGDGRDSWVCDEIENGRVVNKYMVDKIPVNWDGLRSGLIASKAFARAIQNPEIINGVAYGALQTVLSTEGSEANLRLTLSGAMEYTDEEKAEINRLLTSNYFTIQL